ncbi:MAG: T9SS type A sorting domain-containing protein [Saprospiraceae bacterium]|nr:T9SS type A sorting domain-containing protein [Saprospiraceae bacterium]MBP6567393.1 T9SS type A sorting domain-containing protein [Saprospiraceae bacterium]
MKHLITCIFFWLISLMELTGQSCDVNGKKHYTFDDIKFILDKNNCNKCHYKGSYENLWTYDTYENIIAQSTCGSEIIVPGNSYQSLLIDKLNGGPTSCGNAMPLGNKMISDADLLALESWIDIGAPEKCIPVFDQIKTILTINKCNLCHVDSESWSFENYNSVFLKPLNTICEDQELIKYRAKESLLYKKISDKNVCGGPMLVDGDPMSEDHVDSIRDWINAGAPESARVLPVNLLEFSTDKLDDNNIIIFWKTASEINTSHFELETSIDGVHFSFLVKLAADGSELAGGFYQHIFKDPKKGFNYFRMKIVDFDNSYIYSPVRVERIINVNEVFNISPVPTFNNTPFNVEWYPLDGREKARLLIMNINGSLCHDIIINNGVNNLVLSGLKAGVYYLSIEDYNATRIVRKLVVWDF